MYEYRTSLVVQWLGIHLPMQGTWVLSLVREDSTCLRATEPKYTTAELHTLEPALCSRRSPPTANRD